MTTLAHRLAAIDSTPDIAPGGLAIREATVRAMKAASIVLLSMALAGCAGSRDRAVPRLTDEEFWRMSTALSEPGGNFHTDNLVSNELSYAFTLRRLRTFGGVYIGVGPEQNFSFIAAVEPELAFIVDIRAANRVLHLLYKALFELSADRAAFLSRLFSRARPPGLIRDVSVSDLFAEYESARPSPALLEQTTREVTTLLGATHGWALSTADTDEIARVLQAFFEKGLEIHYDFARPVNAQRPSYRTLMTATDQMGIGRSYLASAMRFAFVKDLHARNLIVPVVGDFGTGHVIGRIGIESQRRGLGVTVFYASNVEVYLTNLEMFAFCGSLRGLPQGEDAVFVDSKGDEPLNTKLAACPPDRRPFAGSPRAPSGK